MARGFTGGDSDKLTATISAAASGAWSLGAWMFPTADTGGGGVEVGDSAAMRGFRLYLDFSLRMEAYQRRSGGNGFIIRTSGHFHFTTSVWAFTVATCSGVDEESAVRIYQGTISTGVAEMTDGGTAGGSGSGLDSGGTALTVGNRLATPTTSSFTGRIFAPFMVPWEMTTADMDQVRTGDVCGLTDGGTPAFFFGLEGSALTSYSAVGPSYTLTDTGTSTETDPITLTACGGGGDTVGRRIVRPRPLRNVGHPAYLS